MHKPRVILDSSVVVSGVGWRGGDARRILMLLAVRGFQSYRTPWLTGEWTETVQFVAKNEPRWRNRNWMNWLAWLKRASKLLDDIPVRKTVKRDPNDDGVVMAAVAAQASFIVTSDDDLLSLEKPYGISCLTPREFLAAILQRG